MNQDRSNYMQMHWIGCQEDLYLDSRDMQNAIARVHRPLFAVNHNNTVALTHQGKLVSSAMSTMSDESQEEVRPLLAFVPGIGPGDLGDASFKTNYGLDYAYVMGAMANGISSVEMVRAAGSAGMVGFFGAGGLALDQIERAIHRLQNDTGNHPCGFNLIHSPNDPDLEATTVDLYLQHGVSLVSASAFLGLTPALVRYRVHGIFQTPQGDIVCPNRIIAKVSREEVGRKFFAPPPETILNELVRRGQINEPEAQLARHIPLAQDITAEADSGGHTDNRPALSLFPTITALRDLAQERYGFTMPLRVGLGGGIATPDAVAAAFAMGAAFVLTGSINQACNEADTSLAARRMLAQAQQADVVMAPAADMFELGAKVQVLKRGTMFAMRATKLYDLYRRYDQFSEIPDAEKQWIEKELLKTTFDQAWDQTRHYFESRNPGQLVKAQKEPRHKMALVFRSYLGQASLWAKTGIPDRQIDYQIWCGPAMGAFNAWVKNSFLEPIDQRNVVLLAMNLLYGACRLIRYQWLRHQGVCLDATAGLLRPLTARELEERLDA